MTEKEYTVQDYNIYWAEHSPTDYRVYMVATSYNHSVKYILSTVRVAKNIATLPRLEDIDVRVLGGRRYAGMTSVEFTSTTKPTAGTELTPDSGLWEWLVTP